MSNNSQAEVDFVNFIATEKIKNVKSPMILKQLCREFNKKTGMSYRDDNLLNKIKNIRDKMSEMVNFDIETKVKLMFALGSPVSNGLLIELKKQAYVELDDQHRIIKYKQNEDDFQLSGLHIRSCGFGKEKEMLKLLAEKSKTATLPMTDTTFLKEFLLSEGSLKPAANYHTRYNLLKQQIYLSPGFDQDTKIRMMFVSNTRIHANILEELRQNAVVEVDEDQRIKKYEANNGSLKLEGEHRKLRILESPIEWSKEEREKLLSFIAEKSKQTKVPLFINHLCREFAEKNEVSRTKDAVEFQFHRHCISNISKLDNFDIETRMRMLFALSLPVDEEFLNKLRKEAVVMVDEHRRITEYEALDGSLKLEAKRLPPPTAWSKEENDKLLNHIAEKSKQTKKPLNVRSLCREFIEKNGVCRTEDAVSRNIL